MDKERIIDYVMTTPGNTNPAILNQMIDEVGGGSGDFSTCTGTFICDSLGVNNGLKTNGIVILDLENQYTPLNGWIKSYWPDITSSLTFSIVLYDQTQIIDLREKSSGDIVSISGDIESLGNSLYKITGDFTIHFIGSQEV
jgi:hypothetical protein